MKDGLVNLVGGCCGTTPAHIKYVHVPLCVAFHYCVLFAINVLLFVHSSILLLINVGNVGSLLKT